MILSPAKGFAVSKKRQDQKREQKFTPQEWQRRFNAGAKAAQRDYCELFRLWTACRYKPCRRARKCFGHARSCLERGLERIPDKVQYETNLRIIANITADADEPTRLGRSSDAMSLVFYGPD